MPCSCYSSSMEDEDFEKKAMGCGMLNAIFGRKRRTPRRTISTGSLPTSNPNHVTRFTSIPASISRGDDRFPAGTAGKVAYEKQQLQVGKKQCLNHVKDGKQGRKVPPKIGISGELESLITDHQKSNQAVSLIRASSSNVMLHGNLGNLRHLRANGNDGKYSSNKRIESSEKPVSLCRALSTRMDPEQLKISGNEDYKNGRFAEAVALYDAAISIDPNKASYRSNKSAALFALGKLPEATFECCEAIRIDPFYQRAHNRLAIIYSRLGEVEKSLYHLKQSGPEADPDTMNNAMKIQSHLEKCTEAKRRHSWDIVLKESSLAIKSGADSAPLIIGLKAEALLKLNRVEEAIQTLDNGPDLKIDDCIKIFGPVRSAMFLVYRSKVDMAAGRFEAAMESAHRASRLDPNSSEAKTMSRRTKAVAIARANGNDLFRNRRYSEACIAYGEGLSHDPSNTVLLCNRAACRSKLRQYDKAMEDCDRVIGIRPSYYKARLRRADCYAKLGKWEECLEDCQVLIKENPKDEEVCKLRDQANAQLKDMTTTRTPTPTPTRIIVVSSEESFRDYVTSPGTSVVLFNNKHGNKADMHFIELLHCRYPSVNFLMVEVEDHPMIRKSQGVNLCPCFAIYTRGSKVEEIAGDKCIYLERLIQKHTGRS